jgi:ornithine carbamoyltransferase
MTIEHTSLTGKSLISLHDLFLSEMDLIFDTTAKLKTAGRPLDILRGKTLAMIFEKSSTRTRVSFEVGMYQLGGTALFLNTNDLQLGRGETIADTARVLSRYVDGIMARTFAHQTVVDLSENATVPVINGLTDLLHPCQALADLFTIMEKKGKLAGRKLAFVGDGNNVAHSLMYACAKMGMHFALGCPEGYEPNPAVVAQAKEDAAETGSEIRILHDPVAAVADADAVYADVWTSMGQEAEKEERLAKFAPYQINSDLVARAKPDHLVMHCLPAHRGEEITDDVLDGPHSVVLDEAENRLHVQKAIMALTMI